MKATIIVTDENGNSFEGRADLTAVRPPKGGRKKPKGTPSPKHTDAAGVNFSSPIRAFVKKHARGMGGPQKFALLVAYLAKGDTHKQVPIADIERQWNRMKPLLEGRFNRAHSTRAKEHEWVDSPKTGMYVLLPGWKAIVNA